MVVPSQSYNTKRVYDVFFCRMKYVAGNSAEYMFFIRDLHVVLALRREGSREYFVKSGYTPRQMMMREFLQHKTKTSGMKRNILVLS